MQGNEGQEASCELIPIEAAAAASGWRAPESAHWKPEIRWLNKTMK
jgi:hypothetical protein